MKGPTKSYFLLSALFLSIVISSYLFWGRPGLLWGFMLSLFAHWFIFFYGDDRLLNIYPSTELEGQDAWKIRERIEQLAQKARIPTPRVFVIQSGEMNAYSVARHHRASHILLTSTLIENLTSDELYAVLAHEVARIQRLETVNFSVTSTLMNVFLIWTQPLRPQNRHSSKVLRFFHSFFVHLLGPLVALVRYLAVNSKTYYSIDSQAVEFTGAPMEYVQMLWKLDSYASTQDSTVPLSAAHLFVVSPLGKTGWGRYFQAQPPLEHRIRRLIGYYPI